MNLLLIALYRYQNYPIRIMHSLLEKIDGIKPHVVFFKNCYTNAVAPPTAREEELLRQCIRELDPAIVGLSVYSSHLRPRSGSPPWCGSAPGRGSSGAASTRPSSPSRPSGEADAICVGEGEGAMAELAAALRDGTDFRRIQNLWVAEGACVHRNSMRPLAQDLDALPFPGHARESFAFIDADRLSKKDPTLLDPTLYVLPARGCPFACTFCVNSLLRPLYRDLGPYLRRRSVASVLAEIKEVLSIPGNRKEIVEFHDENFGTDPEWLAEFEERYPREIGLPFKVQYNPSLIKPDTIRRLRAAGLHRVKFGIETGTDRVRNSVFRRPGKNADILRLMRGIAETGVKVRYDLILDNPYDTEETLAETIRLLLALPKPLRANLYSLQFFPGYPLTAKALADGHITAKEASLETLQARMARNWGFQPRLRPFTRRQMLQNLIWLYVGGGVADRSLRRAAFGNSRAARLRRVLLSLAAVARGKIQEIRRRRYHKEY